MFFHDGTMKELQDSYLDSIREEEKAHRVVGVEGLEFYLHLLQKSCFSVFVVFDRGGLRTYGFPIIVC